MSSNAAPPSMPPSENESVLQHIIRSTKNVFTKCFGSARTGNDKAKIQYNQYMIENRKKAFGVAYINLKLAGTGEGATPDEAAMQTLIDNALADINKLQKEIEGFQASILKKQESTNRKIVTKPVTAASASASATTTTAAAAAPAVAATTPAATTETTPAPAAVEAPAAEPAKETTVAPTPVAETTPAAATTTTTTTTESATQ